MRTAFAVLAIIGVLHTPSGLPFSHSAAFDLPARRQRLTGGAVPYPQGQAQEAPRPGPRTDSMLMVRQTAGTLFENVVTVLQNKYYDERFRTEALPGLVSRYSEKARRATSVREQRNVIQEFLSHIPASHLGLLSKQTFRNAIDDLQCRSYPTFGAQLTEIQGQFYAWAVLEGGPAQRAGLLPWDRIVAIDGVPVGQSPRLDWRSDDAYIPDDRDPPVHYLTAAQGDVIRVKVERRRGKFLELTLAAQDYSAFAAARASAKVYKTGGRSFGYLHLWYVHVTGVPELLKEKLEGEFGSCDGLVLDLRGRGGNGAVIAKILDILRAYQASRHRPIVALADRQSRSAKDVLAYEFKKTGIAKLVGEPTAGAVIPATFADVGFETVLMFPSFKLPRYTDLLEFKPVEPDVFVERAGPLSGGDDPILNAGLAEALKLAKSSAKSASGQ